MVKLSIEATAILFLPPLILTAAMYHIFRNNAAVFRRYDGEKKTIALVFLVVAIIGILFVASCAWILFSPGPRPLLA
jgi:low temperature requirement protein LtrA